MDETEIFKLTTDGSIIPMGDDPENEFPAICYIVANTLYGTELYRGTLEDCREYWKYN